MTRSLILIAGALLALAAPLAPSPGIAQTPEAAPSGATGDNPAGAAEPAPQDAAPEVAPDDAPADAPDTDPLPEDAIPSDLPVPADTAPDTAAALPGPITNDLAGPYLAARQAAVGNDFAVAADFFLRALKQDPHEAFLIDSAMVSLVSAGEVDRALTLARTMNGSGDLTELGGLVLRAGLARQGDWAGLLALIAATPASADPTAQGGKLLDGMLAAWADLGAGRATESMARFEALKKIRGTGPLIDYNLALVKASVGDYEGAAALMADQGVGAHLLGTVAHAEVLAQIDRRDDALALLAGQPGALDEPLLVDLSARLAAGQPVPFTGLKGAADGVAQTLLTFATALAGGHEPDPLALIHARLAAWIAPDFGEAHLVAAQLLQSLGQFDLAEPEYEALRSLGAVRPVAELARMDALARADRLEDAQKAAQALTAAHPDLASGWIALGDILRQAENYADAIPAYDKALTLIPADSAEARWFPLYARGIAEERSGDFAAAEADMRAALKIQPEQAAVLNYLGYSFVDRGENLTEAMEMVEKAAALRPEDGYIQDSLAWGYYRLGRYAEAVAPMERAAESMGADPLINDHLGDIYWMVGRQREAEVQWRRALSLANDPATDLTDLDLDRLRAKLDRGLDAVLADEKAGKPPAPAPVANGG